MEDKILKKAADLFLNLGVKSVTMDEIARELGISKKTIYTYFDTKTKLVEATSMHIFDTIASGTISIKSEKRNPIDELFTIKNFILLNLKDDKSSPEFQLKKYYPKIFAKLRAKQKTLIECSILENLERGIDHGLFRSDIKKEFIARIYFIGMTGIKERTVFPEVMFASDELTELFLEYHLRSIVTDQGLKTLTHIIKNNN